MSAMGDILKREKTGLDAVEKVILWVWLDGDARQRRWARDAANKYQEVKEKAEKNELPEMSE